MFPRGLFGVGYHFCGRITSIEMVNGILQDMQCFIRLHRSRKNCLPKARISSTSSVPRTTGIISVTNIYDELYIIIFPSTQKILKV